MKINTWIKIVLGVLAASLVGWLVVLGHKSNETRSLSSDSTPERRAAALPPLNRPIGAVSNGGLLNNAVKTESVPTTEELLASAPPETAARLRKHGIPPVPAGTNTLKTPITISREGKTNMVLWVVSMREETNGFLFVRYISTNSREMAFPKSRVVKIGTPSLDWVAKGRDQ